MTKTTTNLYKQTPLGLIPSDWEVKKLGKLGTIVSGLTYSPDDICEEKGVLVLRSSNVQSGRITFDDNVFVKVNNGDFNPVKKNDILICVRNGSKSLIGKCALVKADAEGMAFGAFMAIFRGDYNDYLIHVFNTDIYNKEIHRNLGATINSINGSDLKEFKIPLPPLPEQKAIAHVLSTADAAIQTTEKLIAQKEQRKKWLMQQLLTGKKRLKGFEGEWKEVRLSEVADIDKLTLSSQTHPEYLFQYLSLSDVDTGTAEIKSEKISFKDAPSRARRIVQKGDVLLATVRPNLQAFLLIREGVKDLIASTGFAVITCKKIHNEFLYQYLFTRELMNQIEAFLTGSNYPAINSSDVKQLKFPYPPIEEQTAIAQVLQAADKEINLLKTKATKLREQKKGLMQQLLTGKVRLKLKH